MAETIDLGKIAHAIVTTLLEKAGKDLIQPDTRSQTRAETDVAEQLRLIWNARGAADIATLETTFKGSVPPSMKTIDHALRRLDQK